MENYLGEIRVFSFGTIPRGWAACAGQLLAINQNQALFSLLGTYYGGNGVQNFALPDFRGQTPIGVGNAAYGTTYVIGEKGGVENVTLTTTTMAAHNHLMNGQSAAAAANLAASPTRIIASPAKSGSTDVLYSFSTANANLTPLNPQSLSMTGSNVAHANMPPFLTLNVCIALQGIFPSRN